MALIKQLAPVQPPDRPVDVRPAPAIQAVAPVQANDSINGMPIPKVRVTFRDSRGGTWESSYHSVSVQGDKVVLVYDLAFEFGSRINPPVDFDNPYELTIIPKRSDDGTPSTPANMWVLNMGIEHTFSHERKQWSFQILTVTDRPKPKVEAEEPAEERRF